VTGYGFIGPMTAMGTVFDAKEAPVVAATMQPQYSQWQMVTMTSSCLWLLAAILKRTA
jgi:hypothetical protein